LKRINSNLQKEIDVVSAGFLVNNFNQPRYKFTFKAKDNEYASCDRNKLYDLFDNNDEGDMKEWLVYVAPNNLQDYSNETLFNYQSKDYTLNNKTLNKNLEKLGIKTEQQANILGTVQLSKELLKELYEKNEQFKGKWFLPANNNLVKPNWPRLVTPKGNRVYFNIKEWNLWSLQKVIDPAFDKALNESGETVVSQVGNTPKDVSVAVRRVTNYIVGKNWVNFCGKNWLVDRKKMIEYVSTPKIRKILFEKITNSSKFLNSDLRKSGIFIMGPEGNLWR